MNTVKVNRKRYGCVLREGTWADALQAARWVARSPGMSIFGKSMRLTVRKVNGRWEAAWEEVA